MAALEQHGWFIQLYCPFQLQHFLICRNLLLGLEEMPALQSDQTHLYNAMCR